MHPNYIFGAGTKWSKNLHRFWPKNFPQNLEQCAAHASKLHIQIDFRHRNKMKQKSIWILAQNFPPKCGAVCSSCIQITQETQWSKNLYGFLTLKLLFLWLIFLGFFLVVCKISNFKYVSRKKFVRKLLVLSWLYCNFKKIWFHF